MKIQCLGFDLSKAWRTEFFLEGFPVMESADLLFIFF